MRPHTSRFRIRSAPAGRGIAASLHRCIGDEVRKGSGDIVLPPEAKKNRGAVAGYSAVEVDAGKLTIRWNCKVQ